MNLRFLETMVWLARLRNFRMTAEKLHTTQAAVSSRIATLEQDFGVRLFDRGTREVTLTQQGAKVLSYAERILSLSQEMQRTVADRATVSGTIRLGVIEVIVHSWLPNLLARIRREYPNLAIELTSDTTLRLSELLAKGGLDVTLQAEPVAGADIVSVDLGSFQMRWVASPTLGIGAEPFDLIDLAAFPIISFSRDSGPHRTVERLTSDLPIGTVQINWITSVAAIIRLTIDGFGIAAVPPAIIQRELSERSLRFLKVTEEFPDLPLSACYRAGPENPVFEVVAGLAQQMACEFALASGTEIALLPKDRVGTWRSAEKND